MTARGSRHEERDARPRPNGHAGGLGAPSAGGRASSSSAAVAPSAASGGRRSHATRAARKRLAAAIEGRRRAEAALAAEERALRRLVERLPGAVVLHDATGRVVFASAAAAEAFGQAPAALVGKRPDELWDFETARQLLPHLERALATGEDQRCERTHRFPSGVAAEEVAFVPLLDAQGRARHVVALSSDVSARRAAGEQLRRAQRFEALGALLGGVAHDFNNVLAVINGYAENAVRELDEQDPLWSDMREVLEAGRRGAVLTRQLLAFGRRQIAAPVPLAPNGVVHELEKMLRRVIGEHVALEVRLAPDCARVMADAAQLEHVLVTLAVSGRQAISGNGALVVETRNAELDPARAARHPGARPGPHVVLSVSDTGRGLDPEALARLRELAAGARSAAPGAELDLAPAFEIVRERGGHVEVESEAGRGTRVSVWLPRTTAEDEARAASEGAQAFATGEGTILFVEDDTSLRAVTGRSLERAGYRVLTAASGEQALETAARHAGRIDLLVTDVVMSGLSGPELARRLAAVHPEATSLFTSGYVDDPAALKDALVTRANFLAKPYTPGALVRRAWEVVSAAPRSRPAPPG